MLTADSGRREEGNWEEMERGRGGVKAEYIMELDSSGRGEGKCSAVGECGRGPVGRRQIGISHLFPPFSSLNFKQFPSTLAPRTLLRALRTLSRFSHPQCRFLPLSPTCFYLSVPRRKKVPDATAAATFLQFI